MSDEILYEDDKIVVKVFRHADHAHIDVTRKGNVETTVRVAPFEAQHGGEKFPTLTIQPAFKTAIQLYPSGYGRGCCFVTVPWSYHNR